MKFMSLICHPERSVSEVEGSKSSLSSWSRSKMSPWSAAIGTITLLLFLTACTDYVAEIDNQIKDFEIHLAQYGEQQVPVSSLDDVVDGNMPESSSSFKPTKAEECAKGLSKECLVGAWSMIGFANVGTGEILPNYDYQAAPGLLTFNEDGSFQFDLPTAAPADLRDVDCNPVFGNWSISGTSLSMHATVGGICLAKQRATFTPTIAADGANIKMTVGGLWLLESATDETSIKSYSSEVFTISAQ